MATQQVNINLQSKPMTVDPAVGAQNTDFITNAVDYRTYNPNKAWLFNPWTGEQRNPDDVRTDVHGLLIVQPLD